MVVSKFTNCCHQLECSQGLRKHICISACKFAGLQNALHIRLLETFLFLQVFKTSQTLHNQRKMTSPQAASFPLLLKDAKLLLNAPYPSVETGYAQTSDGMYHIAASTYMPNCTGEMIKWWFGWIHTTDQYKLWHPLDHVYSSWEGPRDNSSTYIGGHHLVHEYIGGHLAKLKISFLDPALYFGDDWEKEFEKEGYELAVCGRTANWNDETGEAMRTGHLIHLIKKEKIGVRMRSRFWLGDIEGVTDPEVRKCAVPDFLPEGLCRHATEEMAILASILPGLYEKYARKEQGRL